MYVAHTISDEQGNILRSQPLEDHLRQTAALAASFAADFHGEPWAEAAGLAHDVGKSSAQGQRRMKDPKHTPKVDHATRGAQLLQALMPKYPPLLPFAVCGHHGHLPDGKGDEDADTKAGTLSARLRKSVPDCEDFIKDWTIPVPPAPPLRPYDGIRMPRYAYAFFTRMVHSCLVDADFLDTEAFMKDGAVSRGAYEEMPELLRRLDAYMTQFKGKTGLLNDKRKAILQSCVDASALPPGLFTLTVPTGGGKTLASLAFALRHAKAHGLKRVIYAIPYTSILEQTADVFGKAVGAEQVVAHYADAFVPDKQGDAQNEDNEAPELQKKRLSAENWDASLIVTTNVQLFESLYASRVSRCRKLHNLAKSVIVLDEAQLIPTPFLLPCLRALEELALNYGATIVLMSATQPELAQFFGSSLPVREISREIQDTYAVLKRARIEHDGELSLEALAERMTAAHQALCIVNTRARARALHDLLPQEGRFHLSTLMLPDDRRRVLAIIRERLCQNLPCRLVATSLIEAGVDVDFTVGYREETGLDSLLQAAGRVNREGNHSADSSILHVFRVKDEKLCGDTKQRALVSQVVFSTHSDVTQPDAIAAYFNELYDVKGKETLDQKGVLGALDTASCLFPFDSVAGDFKLIQDNAIPVVILPHTDEGERIRQRILTGDVDKALLRRVGAMAVSVYERDADRLLQSGAAIVMEGEAYPVKGERPVMMLLQRDDAYDPDVGLNIAPEEGQGLWG